MEVNFYYSTCYSIWFNSQINLYLFKVCVCKNINIPKIEKITKPDIGKTSENIKKNTIDKYKKDKPNIDIVIKNPNIGIVGTEETNKEISPNIGIVDKKVANKEKNPKIAKANIKK